MAATLAPCIWQRFFDDNGEPLAGGKLYSYEAGTLTPLTTYTDQAGTVANSNPVILDANGYVATAIGNPCGLWLLPDSYKFILTDADDVQLKFLDNIDSTLGVQGVTDALNDAMIFQAGPISDRPAFNPDYGQANHGRIYFATDENKAYRDTGTAWVDVTSDLFPASPARTASINYVIDGGGSAIATGLYGGPTVPTDCTVKGWILRSDQTGSAVVSVKKSTIALYPTTTAMGGANPPTLTAAQIAGALDKLASAAWTTDTFLAGDQIEFEVVSNATCERLNISIIVEIPAVSA
jgi:hypothetical protein